MMIGEKIYALAKRLYPINRSLTGNGVRETLEILKEICPEMTIHEVASGTKVFDWTVPNEWNVEEAWIIGPDGKKFADFKVSNLHLVGYSIPVDVELSLEELSKHLYSLPNQPTAIPYITSYYSPWWGFCLTDIEKQALKPGQYKVHIKSTLAPGSMTYGEILIKGECEKEIFLSTYICHPSMANNELSGPCVTIHIADWVKSLKSRRYSYRIIFIPETIGSITYLSRHLDVMKKNIIAGFNINCVGDDRAYSFLPSRKGDSIADKAALHALKHHTSNFVKYSYLDRGSDERQYCAPGVDLPVASIMRSKYAEYPEYHTSLDNLDLITPAGLAGGFNVTCKAIEAIEASSRPRVTVLCEPQLGKRGLYPSLSTLEQGSIVQTMLNLIAYCDGEHTLLEIAEKINSSMDEILPIYNNLKKHNLLVDDGL